MPKMELFVHLQGETFGPVTQEVITIMLRQNRLHFSDFVWYSGLTKWARLGEIHAFQAMMPPYPGVDIPGAPVVAAAPAPVAAPAPMLSDTNKLRRHARVVFSGTVVVDGLGTFPAVDISEGGVFLCSNEPLAFGLEVKFQLSSPVLEKSLDMTGIVIRKGVSEAGQPGFAIEFTRVNPAHRRLINSYVASKAPIAA